MPSTSLSMLREWLVRQTPADASDQRCLTLLLQLCDAPDQTLEWASPLIPQLFESTHLAWSTQVADCRRLHAAALQRMQSFPCAHQWDLLPIREPSPGVRLAPGRWMIDRLRSFMPPDPEGIPARDGQPAQRRF